MPRGQAGRHYKLPMYILSYRRSGMVLPSQENRPDCADLYRISRQTPCMISQHFGITVAVAKAEIHAAGLHGLTWCSVHRTYEEL